MLNIFRRSKKETVDPVLEMIKQQTKELSEINKSLTKSRELVEQDITKMENALRQNGYSDEDINRLKFKVVEKES